jgi:hypothetical protein
VHNRGELFNVSKHVSYSNGIDDDIMLGLAHLYSLGDSTVFLAYVYNGIDDYVPKLNSLCLYAVKKMFPTQFHALIAQPYWISVH